MVELLVVMAIIAILAALLLPALARAKETAKRTQCISNQHQHALAWTMYVEDNQDTFPITSGWGDFAGQPGTPTATTQWLIPAFGIATPAANRPLNKYAPAPADWHCPSDQGDPNYGAKNCFIEYGLSYCTQWYIDPWGVQHVTDQPGGSPLQLRQLLARPATKILQGDWIWENAGFDPAVNIPWHSYKNQRRYVMLFGDNHVEFYAFPRNINATAPASPTNAYW